MDEKGLGCYFLYLTQCEGEGWEKWRCMAKRGILSGWHGYCNKNWQRRVDMDRKKAIETVYGACAVEDFEKYEYRLPSEAMSYRGEYEEWDSLWGWQGAPATENKSLFYRWPKVEEKAEEKPVFCFKGRLNCPECGEKIAVRVNLDEDLPF